MYSEEFIKRVGDANDIVDVIGEYTDLKRAGSEFKGLSPFTNEKTPSFAVNPGKQVWHCWSSDRKGNLFKFIMEADGLSFPDSVKKMAQRANIPIEEEAESPEVAAQRKSRDRLKEAHRQAADWFHDLLMKSHDPGPQMARDYLKQRGVSGEVARRWKLGYAPKFGNAMVQWARKRGLREPDLAEGGLLGRGDRGFYGFFRHRLMFPILDQYGNVIAFSGRELEKSSDGRKYVNSPATPIFDKSSTFFGLFQAKRSILNSQFVIICEGQLDVIAASEAGVENIVAPLGTAFNEAHAQVLRKDVREAVLCLDSDRAGIKATDRVFEHLAKTGIFAKVARMPEGEDPDSMIKSVGADAFRDVIHNAIDYFDFQLEIGLPDPQNASPHDRWTLMNKIAEKLLHVGDEVQRRIVTERVSRLLGVASDDIEGATSQMRQREQMRAIRQAARQKTIESAPDILPPSNVLRTLTRLMANNGEAREWIFEHADRTVLDFLPGSQLLTLLWDGDFDPEDPQSQHQFLETLPEEAKRALNWLNDEKAPPSSVELAEDCWMAIQREVLGRQLREAKARLKDPSLPADQLVQSLERVKEIEAELKSMPKPRV
ncbi:MAG: DNA primase [Verrucomicrobiota bacterium]